MDPISCNFQDPIDFWVYWDPTDPYDIKLLQEYVGSNGSVIYLPNSTIMSLINLWDYMNLLIKKGKYFDQKYNAQYFDQWFNLTAPRHEDNPGQCRNKVP